MKNHLKKFDEFKAELEAQEIQAELEAQKKKKKWQKIVEKLKPQIDKYAAISDEFKIGRSGQSVDGELHVTEKAVELADRANKAYDEEFKSKPKTGIVHESSDAEEVKYIENELIRYAIKERKFSNCLNKRVGGGPKPKDPKGFRVYVRFTKKKKQAKAAPKTTAENATVKKAAVPKATTSKATTRTKSPVKTNRSKK